MKRKEIEKLLLEVEHLLRCSDETVYVLKYLLNELNNPDCKEMIPDSLPSVYKNALFALMQLIDINKNFKMNMEEVMSESEAVLGIMADTESKSCSFYRNSKSADDGLKCCPLCGRMVAESRTVCICGFDFRNNSAIKNAASTSSQAENAEVYSRDGAFGSTATSDSTDLSVSKVEFSAIAPKAIKKGEYAIIDIIMYEESYRSVVDELIKSSDVPVQEKRSGIHKVGKSSEVKIILRSSDITIGEMTEKGIWEEGHLDFSFAFDIPSDYSKNSILFTASVYINDVIASNLRFIINCSQTSGQSISIIRNDIFSAFISYASKDRNRVAAIVQGMQKARPDMKVFFDVESLNSGEVWHRAIHKEIDNSDVLYLCWSHNAMESKWVDEEWRYALKKKGINGIEPIPIESPEICPPPAELSEKHFNDRLLYIIEA